MERAGWADLVCWFDWLDWEDWADWLEVEVEVEVVVLWVDDEPDEEDPEEEEPPEENEPEVEEPDDNDPMEVLGWTLEELLIVDTDIAFVPAFPSLMVIFP